MRRAACALRRGSRRYTPRVRPEPEAETPEFSPWPPDLLDAATTDPMLALLLTGVGPRAVVRRVQRPDDEARRAVERALSTPCAYDIPELRWDEARVAALSPAAQRRARRRFDEAARTLRGRAQGLYLASLVARRDPSLSDRLRGWFRGASPRARVQIARALMEDGAPRDRAWLDALVTLLDDDALDGSVTASLGARAVIARDADGGLAALSAWLSPARVHAASWRAQGILEALAAEGSADRAWLPVLRPLLAHPAVAEDVAVVLARHRLDAGWIDDLVASITAAFEEPGRVIDQRLATLAPIADARCVPVLQRALRQNPGVARWVDPALRRIEG